jgi:NADH-quinone oxidoreductase subunit D
MAASSTDKSTSIPGVSPTLTREYQAPDTAAKAEQGLASYRDQTQDIIGEKLTINMGPSHPATHGVLRLVLELDGEIITKATTDVGYLHRGDEKIAENMSYNQFVPYTDRLDYLAPLANNVAYALAVEKLMGWEVPPRGQAIRVICCELARISAHMLGLGAYAMDVGAMTVFLYTFTQREYIYNLCEIISGARFTTSYTRVGGQTRDLPSGFEATLKSFLDQLAPAIEEIDALLSRNRIFIERTRDVGVITREQAIAYGLTGPNLRGSGVEHDLRKAAPYLGYEQYDFEVPVLTEGDVYTRYLIRLAEIRQSMRIVRQALDNLPSGHWNALGKVTLPDKDDVYTKMESLIHHFMLEMPGHGLKTPLGQVYHATESPNGELGWFIVSDGTGVPYRVRVRPPSFYQFQSIQPMVTGGLIADTVAVMSSLNVIAGELDR